jgi:oxygen-independent coproporphyrinogen-3 oxidase
MILRIEGDINRYYAQTLCMIFFPGATFGEDEERAEGVPEVNISTYKDLESGVDVAYASIRLNDKFCEATEPIAYNEEITIATHASIAAGRALFAAGKELLGYTPPWGILTGVRPAKVAASLLYSGKGIIKTRRIMRDEYFLNQQKAALVTAVASNEIKLLKKVPKNTCSIYISIPFCPSRCAYCSFVSYTTQRLLGMVDEYLDQLVIDLAETVDTIKSLGLGIHTVYIGGGTPTTLNVDQLERLLGTVNELIDVPSLAEFTLEAGRPDTITAEKLATAKKHGVTRISVNPQTLSDDVLREIGRKHTTEQFYDAFKLAKESGIRDINVDLIAGLPGDDFQNFSATMDKIIELNPTNITVHTFCVKKAADILKKNSNVYSIAGGDATKSVSYSQLKAKFAGYKPYYMYRQKNTVGNLENVGFSIEGHEGLYNVLMMEDIQTIFAVGASAVTKLVHHKPNGETVIERIFNPKYPYEYLSQRKDAASATDKPAKTTARERIIDFYSKF